MLRIEGRDLRFVAPRLLYKLSHFRSPSPPGQSSGSGFRACIVGCLGGFFIRGALSLTFGLMPAGGFQAGYLADTFNAQVAVIIGGMIVVGFVSILLLQGSLRKRIRDASTVVSETEPEPAATR